MHGTIRFHKLQRGEIEHVSICAGCCILLPRYLQTLYMFCGYTHARMCLQAYAVAYGATRHYADIVVANMHDTMHCLNGF